MAHHSSIDIGNHAEMEACQFLEKHGLRLVEKNFTVQNENGVKTGEIDLIMRDKEYYVFVEVKARNASDYGEPLEMVTKQKQTNIIHVAKHYLVRNYLFHSAFCRFDVVGISPGKTIHGTNEITWIKDAFQVECR